MSPFFFDLSARTNLLVTGADRVRFLNGQTTNDVHKATSETVQESCVLNAKGHLDAHLFLFATAETIWIDADEQLRERLPARLEHYIIADDVSIEDVSERFALFHLVRSVQPRLSGAEFCLASNRFGEIGWDLWCNAADKPKLQDALSAGNEFVDAEALETLRIERGVPRWGCELTPEIIPVEANLQERAIDYAKGCYIGQEVISRMKISGQSRQRLCGVVAEEKVWAGMELCAGEKVAGKITSAVLSPRLNAYIALALIKRPFQEVDSRLTARAASRSTMVRVSTLPFLANYSERTSREG